MLSPSCARVRLCRCLIWSHSTNSFDHIPRTLETQYVSQSISCFFWFHFGVQLLPHLMTLETQYVSRCNFFFGFIWVYNRCLMKPQTLWHDITISITSQYVLWYLVNCVRCNETQTLSHDVTMSIAWCDKLYGMMWQTLLHDVTMSITFQSILQSFRFVNFD